MAYGTNQGELKIWDINKKTPTDIFTGHTQSINVLAWKDDNIISTGSDDKSIQTFDVRSKNNLGKYLGHGDLICGLKYSNDGCLLASGGNDSKLII